MKAYIGDITKVRDVDVIVNAANGIGIMGAGLAGALARSGGKLLREEAREHCKKYGPFPAGSCYETDPGLLKRRGIRKIYHAVTMDFPGQASSIENVVNSLQATLTRALIAGIESIAIPGLGTGIGGLDTTQVAQRMVSVLKPYRGQMQIIIIDRNKDFIEAFKKTTGASKRE